MANGALTSATYDIDGGQQLVAPETAARLPVRPDPSPTGADGPEPPS
ncbi:hypothetical protein ACWDO6_11430 [Streptomyces sp. NPDC003674]